MIILLEICKFKNKRIISLLFIFNYFLMMLNSEHFIICFKFNDYNFKMQRSPKPKSIINNTPNIMSRLKVFVRVRPIMEKERALLEKKKQEEIIKI